jgi:putative FmdB family regulatory protein
MDFGVPAVAISCEGTIRMPLYEYQCRKCQETVEVIQRMSDPPQSLCAKCGGDMKKLISSPAIQFKGSGFYKTDYASSSSKGGSESKSDSKSDSKSESKSESKTESSKSESKGDSAKSE